MKHSKPARLVPIDGPFTKTRTEPAPPLFGGLAPVGSVAQRTKVAARPKGGAGNAVGEETVPALAPCCGHRSESTTGVQS